MVSSQPSALRVVALLQQLEQRFGAQEFGQIVQTLLALTIRRAGYDVLRNTVGVPDLVVSRRNSNEGYAIEVKTGEKRISISQRDLDGVLSNGRAPVVAALFTSDPSPHWLLLSAHSLKAGSYRRFELETKPRVNFDFDVNEGFQRVLLGTHATAMEGLAPLTRLLATA